MLGPEDEKFGHGGGGPAVPLRRRLPAIIALAAIAAGIGGGLVALALSEGEPKGEDIQLIGRTASRALLGGLGQEDAVLGDDSAPIRISYFTDLQCASCGRYHRRVMPRLVDRLVRTGRASIRLRHFSISARERTVAAIAAAAAAEQRREWNFADLFIRNQRLVPETGVDEGFLRNIARAAELDVRSWEDEQRSDDVERRLDADATAARQLRLPAQPAMVVEGRRGFRKLVSSPSATRIIATARALR